MADGLDGEEVEEEGEGRARFESRREKSGKRGKDGKRKNIKDRDWILRKKEVRVCSLRNIESLIDDVCSFLVVSPTR